MTVTDAAGGVRSEPTDEAKPARAPVIWRVVTGDEQWKRSTILAWLLLVVVMTVVLQSTLRFDFRDQPIAGDQSSHLLQALSLAGDGHDLRYDAADMDQWRDVGWIATPTSLFFQESDGGYAFAKPYLYSAIVAPFVWALGAVPGVALANSALLTLLVVLIVTLLRVRWRGPAIPLCVIAFVFASYCFMYAFVLHTELAIAVLVTVVCVLTAWFWYTRSLAFAAGAAAVIGVAIPEKPQFVALFAPLLVALLLREGRWWGRAVLLVAALVAFAVATVPYRHYSDGESWNAYQGERYVTYGPTPFDRPALATERTCPPMCRVGPDVADTSIDGLRTRLESERGQFASIVYFFGGRYTGVLPFMPFAIGILVVCLVRWKRLDGLAVAALVSLGAYVLLEVGLYAQNYWGGGQSLGNRYFLQAAPVVLLALVGSGMSPRWSSRLALISIVLGVAFMYPHLVRPHEAYLRMDRTSPVQRLLPIENNQVFRNFFRCPIYGDCSQTRQVLPGFDG